LYKKKILVVQGGNSKERNISLLTAKYCTNAIKKLGYKIIKFDPKFSSLIDLKRNNPDLIFNALHGEGGEDGYIQSFFEYHKIPYTHSGVVSSMVTMNKYLSKKIFIKNKIRTPKFYFIDNKNNSVFDLKRQLSKNLIKFPVVIKPNNEGSSIGVKICKNFKSLKREYNKLSNFYEELLIENYIPGKEIQVAVMGKKSLGAIELRPRRQFYDYYAKYRKSSKTEHVMPAEISKSKYQEVLKLSEKTVKILKCRGVVRCDFRFYKNKFYLLEANTQPGMTNLSLVPEIARYKNISFVKLIDWMIKDSTINR